MNKKTRRGELKRKVINTGDTQIFQIFICFCLFLPSRKSHCSLLLCMQS